MSLRGAPVDVELMSAFTAAADEHGLLPVKVTPHYDALVAEEIEAIGPGGPLYRNVYPTAGRLALQAPFEVADFVTDEENMGEDADHVYIQKYGNRILALLTDRCFAHCQYCFRTVLLAGEHELKLPGLAEKTDTIAAAVADNEKIEEVIFSGGDPLTIPYRSLRRVFGTIREARSDIGLRVHTRGIAFAPSVIGDDLSEVLGEFDVRTYFHITHPYEIADPQRAAFGRLRKHDVRMYNQSPVIRGVNDNAEVLGRLVTGLETEHVRPLSFFIADPIKFGADYRVPLRSLYGIQDELRHTLPSWAATFRLVLDTPIGKVGREDITSWDGDAVTFSRRDREGKMQEVVYYDLPDDMYVPGEVNRMLWKERANAEP